jgi:hypothetical protein
MARIAPDGLLLPFAYRGNTGDLHSSTTLK